jgi:hypothetical protein
MERIIDWLWEGQPPASAAQNLYNHISDLRRHLDTDNGDQERIQNQSGCYLLRVDPGELDAEVFEELTRQGQHAAQERQHAPAVERLTRALGLCVAILFSTTLHCLSRSKPKPLDWNNYELKRSKQPSIFAWSSAITAN